MSEKNPKVIEVSTELAEPISISPSELKAVVYPGQKIDWTVTVKNAEGAPTYKMIYGFGVGYLPPTQDSVDAVTRDWKLNDEPVPDKIILHGGEEHVNVMTLTISIDAVGPLTLMLSFKAYRSEMVES